MRLRGGTGCHTQFSVCIEEPACCATDDTHDCYGAGIHLSDPVIHSAVTAPLGRAVVCCMNDFSDQRGALLRAVAVSLAIARSSETKGGLLVHGALVARNDYGVLLSGPSGIGKSTAANRIEPPWRSLCDDTTLVVCDELGGYWAHPWPTWSRFYEDGTGTGSWDVADALPLKAIFFLARGEEEAGEDVAVPQAAATLAQRAYDCSWSVLEGKPTERVQAIRVQQFENALGIARHVPSHMLPVTLINPFWHAMDRAIESDTKGRP